MTRPVLLASALSYNSLEDARLWGSWIKHRVAIRTSHAPGVRFFAALEFDGRGRDPFGEVLWTFSYDRAPVDSWFYGLDDGRTEITQTNRLRHFVMGQNLCIERALELGAHLLYVGAGVSLPPDILPRLLETGQRAVGPYVPAYAQSGPELPNVGGYPLQDALPAGAILLDHSLLEAGIRWRSHSDGLSDDFGLRRDLLRFHGVRTAIRTDVVAHKHPAQAVPVEQRGYDRSVHW